MVVMDIRIVVVGWSWFSRGVKDKCFMSWCNIEIILHGTGTTVIRRRSSSKNIVVASSVACCVGCSILMMMRG
jgi:hypothetical protein